MFVFLNLAGQMLKMARVPHALPGSLLELSACKLCLSTMMLGCVFERLPESSILHCCVLIERIGVGHVALLAGSVTLTGDRPAMGCRCPAELLMLISRTLLSMALLILHT